MVTFLRVISNIASPRHSLINNFDRSVFSHITNWSTLTFCFNLKPKRGKSDFKSTCNLTHVSRNESIFFKIGLISIIRKTKGTKPQVSSALIILLVISATIEIEG